MNNTNLSSQANPVIFQVGRKKEREERSRKGRSRDREKETERY